MVTIDKEPIQEKQKKPSTIKLALYSIFVKDIGLKALSLALSVTLWIIATGL